MIGWVSLAVLILLGVYAAWRVLRSFLAFRRRVVDPAAPASDVDDGSVFTNVDRPGDHFLGDNDRDADAPQEQP